jgi:Reverse transcriptase (RNA-dependent DNA polymerase)
MVHDVKIDGCLKGQLVAAGNSTLEVSKEEVFASVVSMEAVHLGFILAQLNRLLVCAGNVGNAFLYGKTREKICIVAEPEFGHDFAGKWLIIDKALYGLKSSSARFHEHLSVKLRKLEFLPSKADPDLWICKLNNETY